MQYAMQRESYSKITVRSPFPTGYKYPTLFVGWVSLDMCELKKVPQNASLSQEFLFMIVASYEIKQVSVLQ